MNVEPEAKTTEFDVPDPNTLPVLFVPWVKTEPELNVRPLASAAVKLWVVDALEENVIEPPMLPVAPVPTAIVIALVVLQFSAEPD